MTSSFKLQANALRTLALTLLLFVTTARAATPAIEVMVLGTYHMANPGKDLVNAAIDDVTTASRQRELADLTLRLAAFKPTKIAVEAAPISDDFSVPAYRSFRPAQLLTDRNETTQIGYRLAYHLGHSEVYAIDERSSTIDYFPFGAVQLAAKAAGREAALAQLVSDAQAAATQLEARQRTQTVPQLLASLNTPTAIHASQQFYTGLMTLGGRVAGGAGGGGAKPWAGAELSAAWYLRNAKIFAKLAKIAQPGDRIVLVFGAGHAYQLREFVATAKGYRLVEPNRYLLP